jgi:hypothetical protein
MVDLLLNAVKKLTRGLSSLEARFSWHAQCM